MSIRRYVTKDGTVSYHLRLRVVGADGTVHHAQRTVRGTKREAQDALARWKVEIERGLAVDRSTLTVGALLAYWLDTYIKDRVAITTYDSYANVVRLHLTPGLGGVLVQSLTPLRIQQFYRSLEQQGSSDVIVRRCTLHLGRALDVAVSPLGILPQNPAQLARLPERKAKPGTKRPKIALTQEQAHTFLEAAQQSVWGPLYALLLTTGIRRGEALGLRWGDWEQTATREAPHGRLRIAQIVRSLPRGWEISPAAKSEAGERVVVLTASVAAALHSQQARVATMRSGTGEQWTEHGLVFPAPDGGPVGPNNLRGHYRRCIAAAGVPLLTVHGTRHTFATLALQAKVPVHVVSRMLGHANIGITLRVYAHVLKEQETDAASIMEDVIFGNETEGEIRVQQ